MKKLFKEFKAFISRGNVLDLAVGMIIGAAFTAIVSSLVSNILTPLINLIPGTGDTGALQLVLREAVTDAEGVVITAPLILDFGAVISAIVTFILTAVVLFIIVKAVNSARTAGQGAKSKRAARKELKRRKKLGLPLEDPKEEPAPVEPVETTEDLLRKIIVLLENKQETK